jgi:hypothetical protein
MNKKKQGHTGKPSDPKIKRTVFLQTPHRRSYQVNEPTDIWRVSLCAPKKGSLTLEMSLVLPLLLCAVTALLWMFAFTALQARSYRSLTERAQTLAVTAYQMSEADPYIRLYDSRMAAAPFPTLNFGTRWTMQQVEVRAWVGYTGESFQENAKGQIVYVALNGEVYHKSRDCTYLRLTVRAIAASSVKKERNQSGERYTACEYCVTAGRSSGIVYITDYGTSYHASSACQGLKRTIMAVPLSETSGLRSCSRCGGGT